MRLVLMFHTLKYKSPARINGERPLVEVPLLLTSLPLIFELVLDDDAVVLPVKKSYLDDVNSETVNERRPQLCGDK